MNDKREANEAAFEMVEVLLRRMRPRDDAHARTQILRDRFESASCMFDCSPLLLEKLGVHPTDALLLSHMHELSRCVKFQSFPEKPRLTTLEEASPYILANYHALKVERFYLFCLDSRGHMKARYLLNQGTDDAALFSLKDLLSRMMGAKCRAIIVSHNHPMRTLRPSQEDIDCTLQIINAVSTVGIPLLDHLIVAGDQVVSLRDNGFIPAARWMAQNPDSRLLRNWLLPPKPPKPKPPAPPKPLPKRVIVQPSTQLRILAELALEDREAAEKLAAQLKLRLPSELELAFWRASHKPRKTPKGKKRVIEARNGLFYEIEIDLPPEEASTPAPKKKSAPKGPSAKNSGDDPAKSD